MLRTLPPMLISLADPPTHDNVMGLRVIKSRECRPGQALVVNNNGDAFDVDFGPPVGCVSVEEEREVGRGLRVVLD